MIRLSVLRRLSSVLCALALSACATPPRLTAPAADPVAALLAHPDAPKVAHDYPDFFRYVGGLIADLKHDLTIEANK